MKKGFTLAELLGVLVILGLIAIITFPAISKSFYNSKVKLCESQLKEIESAARAFATDNILLLPTGEGEKYIVTLKDLSDKGYIDSNIENPLTNKKFNKNTTKVEITRVGKKYTYKIDNQTRLSCNSSSSNSGSSSNNGENSNSSSSTGLTKIAAQKGETHKGIVYMDPTDLTKICTAEDVASNVNANGTPTEVKTGCMKWYIYDDNGDNYKMILDHNTTAIVHWSLSGSNIAYSSSLAPSLAKQYTDMLVSANKWKIPPRLITVAEVNAITGNASFDASSTSSWYYLDRASTGSDFQTQYANETTKSSYAWLYDYLKDSVTFGANYNDNNTYALADNTATTEKIWGYWTSDAVGNQYIWQVRCTGTLIYGVSSDTLFGIRPVVEMPKTSINRSSKYTVTYNANGGTGTMNTTENIVVLNTFTAPEGKKFKEWNTKTDGSGTKYETTSTVSKDLTLYAIWEDIKPIRIIPTEGETHKGIVYMDPTNLKRECNILNSVSATGTKTGCMSFYIYDDSGDTYKMILDHNTTAKIAWVNIEDFTAAGGVGVGSNNRYPTNAKGPITVNNQLIADTAGWVGNPRLITKDEVVPFKSVSNNEWIRDNVKGTSYKSSITYKYKGTSDNAPRDVIGYWTSTPAVDLQEYPDSYAYAVAYHDLIAIDSPQYSGGNGVRPVIEVSKSLLN